MMHVTAYNAMPGRITPRILRFRWRNSKNFLPKNEFGHNFSALAGLQPAVNFASLETRLGGMKIPYVVMTLLAALFLSAFLYDRPQAIVQTDETVTITYWEKWTGFEGEAMKSTIDLFNRRKFKNKKGQTIYCQCLSVTQVDRKSLLAIAGNSPPDLCGFWSWNTHLFADMGAIQPLDDLIARDKFDMNKYIDVYRQMCQHRGKVWCLPTTPATCALHWNKEMFRKAGLDPERPPRTIQELDEYADKLTVAENGKITQMGFLPPEPGWWNYAWGFYFGGKLSDGLDKVTASDPRNIQAYNWITRYSQKYGGPNTLAYQQGFGTFDSPQNAFLSGKVAMVLQGVWMANFIRFHNPQLKWGCGPFPSSFDTQGQPVTLADMDVITIPTGCKHPDEAWEVIKYINSTEGMEYLCGKVTDPLTGELNSGGQGKLTPFKECTPEFVNRHPHPYLRVFIDLAKSKNARYTPRLAIWSEYKKEMEAAFDALYLKEGKLRAEDKLRSVQELLQRKLDRVFAVKKLRFGTGN